MSGEKAEDDKDSDLEPEQSSKHAPVSSNATSGVDKSSDSVVSGNEIDENNVKIAVEKLEKLERNKTDCARCETPWKTAKFSGKCVECIVCRLFFCLDCADFKRADMAVIGRDDVFWVCTSCKAESNKAGLGCVEVLAKSIEALDEKVKNTITEAIPSAMENSVKPMIEKIIPLVVTVVEKAIEPAVEKTVLPAIQQSVADSVDNAVRTSVAKSWADILLGDDYPKIGSPEAQSAPMKPKAAFNSALKRAFADHRVDESRRNNIILYSAVETIEPSKEKRDESDLKLVEDLLDHLGVPRSPKEVIRLGQYKEDNTRPRPIKVVFDSSAVQTEVMDNTNKLKDAPANLKALSVQYDMNDQERDQCRMVVKEAKEN